MCSKETGLLTDTISKAALCCINAGDFAAAQAHLDQCPATEASTHYLGFLIAAQQGRELAGSLRLSISADICQLFLPSAQSSTVMTSTASSFS